MYLSRKHENFSKFRHLSSEYECLCQTISEYMQSQYMGNMSVMLLNTKMSSQSMTSQKVRISASIFSFLRIVTESNKKGQNNSVDHSRSSTVCNNVFNLTCKLRAKNSFKIMRRVYLTGDILTCCKYPENLVAAKEMAFLISFRIDRCFSKLFSNFFERRRL